MATVGMYFALCFSLLALLSTLFFWKKREGKASFWTHLKTAGLLAGGTVLAVAIPTGFQSILVGIPIAAGFIAASGYLGYVLVINPLWNRFTEGFSC